MEPVIANASRTYERFSIKKIECTSLWCWDVANDTCAICRVSLSEPSIDYQADPSPAKKNGLQIAFATCSHSFHLDCVQKWLKARTACPLCNQEWCYSRYESIPGYEFNDKNNEE